MLNEPNTQCPPDTSSPETLDSTSRETLPNFLYLGTSKAGSTWIFQLLRTHPDVFVVPNKGLYFFDGHYHFGVNWYLDQFQPGRTHQLRADISHSYLSSPEACERIAMLNPNMKMMVCLREPVELAFSAYLDGVKNGKLRGDFEQALQEDESLIERGRYAKHLRPYLEMFGRDRIHIGIFDQLRSAPAQFSTDLQAFLGVEWIELPTTMHRRMMPAGRPRSQSLVRMAKGLSHLSSRIGLKQLRGRVKASRLVRNFLYQPYSQQSKPKINNETREALRRQFREEIEELDDLLDMQFTQLWKYGE